MMKTTGVTVPPISRKEAGGQTFLGLSGALHAGSPIRKGMNDDAITVRFTVTTETVIGLLNDALAMEVLDILRYKRQYFTTNGIGARRVKRTLLQYVSEAQTQADHLATRIVQMGGQAVLSLERLLNRSYAEHVEGDSLQEMITVDLLAERSAIETFREMIVFLGTEDPTTGHVLERILVQKEAHAKDLASLVRELASHRGGT